MKKAAKYVAFFYGELVKYKNKRLAAGVLKKRGEMEISPRLKSNIL